MDSRRLRMIALGLALSMPATGAQAREKNVEWKLAQPFPAAHPLQSGLESWAAAMQKASDGSIQVRISTGSKPAEAYDLVRDGKVEAAVIEPANQLAHFPVIAAAALPLTIANARSGSAALDEWYRSYAAREMKDVKFCLAFVSEPGTLHMRGGKIVGPKELGGLRVQVPNEMMAVFVSRLSASAISAPETATGDLLQSRGAEGVVAGWDSLSFFGFDTAVKYHLDVPLYVSPLALVINKAAFGALSQAQKNVIEAHCSTPSAVQVVAPWAEAAQAARRQLLSAPGHEVYALTPEQIGAWRAATQSLQESWALNTRRAGIDPGSAMKDLKDLLGKYKAAY